MKYPPDVIIIEHRSPEEQRLLETIAEIVKRHRAAAKAECEPHYKALAEINALYQQPFIAIFEKKQEDTP